MPYDHCKKCKAELDDPTHREVITGFIKCWNCEYEHEIIGVKEIREEYFIELEERIIELEKKLANLA